MVNATISELGHSSSTDSASNGAAARRAAARRASATALALVSAFAATVCTPDAARAQATGNASATSAGLSVKVEWWNVGSAAGGYSPVRIEVKNSTKTPRRLRFLFDATYPRDLEISQTIEVDASTTAAFTMSVPFVSYQMFGRLRVYERGRELDKLRMVGVAGTTWWGGQNMPTILIVSRTSPDLRYLTEAASRVGSGQSGAQAGYLALVVPVEKAPTKWIDYSSLDVVMLSTQQLDQLSADSRDAIITWTTAGGNLFVYGAKDGEKSPELARLLDLDGRAPRSAEWRPPRPEDRSTEMMLSGQGSMVRTPRGMVRVAVRKVPGQGQIATPTVAPDSATAAAKANFKIRPFGLGQIIVSSDSEPFPGAIEDWAWVLKSFGHDRLYWSERHGMTARSQNDDFWRFLIPGVGRAPVMGFQVLITLFAVLIGPVNYFVLRRQRKLYLLILTVPAVAFATTLLLLGYAMASDGFALRTRVRSLTMLDQRRGAAVSWTRISYYAGLAPTGGLHFSRDTAVYPIQSTGGGASQSKITDWTDEQHLTSGWLPARTPTQLLTVSHRQADEQLTIATESGSQKMRVTNNLGAKILGLFVVGDDGALYEAEDVASGGSALLEPQSLDDAVKAVRALVGDQKLELPEEMQQAANTGGLFGSRRGPMMYWNQFAPTTPAGSVVESALHAFAGDPKDLQSFLPPRSYIAVVEKPPLVDLGVQKTEDRGSLYVIWGLY